MISKMARTPIMGYLPFPRQSSVGFSGKMGEISGFDGRFLRRLPDIILKNQSHPAQPGVAIPAISGKMWDSP
jgi:hypothetical protein